MDKCDIQKYPDHICAGGGFGPVRTAPTMQLKLFVYFNTFSYIIHSKDITKSKLISPTFITFVVSKVIVNT